MGAFQVTGSRERSAHHQRTTRSRASRRALAFIDDAASLASAVVGEHVQAPPIPPRGKRRPRHHMIDAHRPSAFAEPGPRVSRRQARREVLHVGTAAWSLSHPHHHPGTSSESSLARTTTVWPGRGWKSPIGAVSYSEVRTSVSIVRTAKVRRTDQGTTHRSGVLPHPRSAYRLHAARRAIFPNFHRP